MEDIHALIREKLRSFRFIHYAMIMGSFTYGVVIVFIHLYAPIPPTINDVSTLTSVTYGIFAYTLLAIGMIRYLRPKLLSSDQIFKKNEVAEKSNQPSFFSNYMSTLFILWSICEAVTIGGIILYLIGGQLEVPLLLIGFGIFLKLVNGPKFEELTALEKRYAAIEMQG
ncbi:MAG: hypothetical protein A2023_03015 [Sulfuricurvum sp. GWF2_44_89]|uniref:Uncharacterized protein n=1 Tax=Sulfuricurvum kujiense TaxID=148813 RepID=A0A2D3WGG9_9BACT|nr:MULTISPECIES: hypothetical protein [Sulfuricurvum]OHD78942.1 MAG: hypothetical protein A2023_03015 [Sulfuricurvum sp. GWF2_44_89]OHD92291.1 MAG: hypothetical protein A2552_06625 [Sulfuricurvum sp. RIFOXYD2_FULL_44_160]OHD93264.1 MAG: hypothetical protein A2517_07965 [Sulfuricurvum sp. RIFOXYD12_FULL_44_77]DAB39508.1 MAG TPA: hypothetical protein CFH83_00355 [Sulfuricurvum kujiense]